MQTFIQCTHGAVYVVDYRCPRIRSPAQLLEVFCSEGAWCILTQIYSLYVVRRNCCRERPIQTVAGRGPSKLLQGEAHPNCCRERPIQTVAGRGPSKLLQGEAHINCALYYVDKVAKMTPCPCIRQSIKAE